MTEWTVILNKFEERDNRLYINGKKVIAGWESYTGWYWFATEVIQHQDTIINEKEYKNDVIYHGFVQGFEEEWGDFSKAEIESLGENVVWKIPQENLVFSGRRN